MVEGSELGQEHGVAAAPLVIVELIGQEFHFNEGLTLRMKVAAGVASEVLDLVIEAFGKVRRAELGVDGSRVV